MRNLAKRIVLSPKPQFSDSKNKNPEKSSLKNPSAVKAPVFFISVLGTVLEYFEYAIYGFLAPVLALHFFPGSDPTIGMVKAFGVFAVGSLSKPLGALIFGYLGDVKGRRISLRYSMVGISFPTFIVGILPGYESWGWKAPFVLVLCRMFQGIFLAGESDGARIYAFEHFGLKRPCLVGSIVGSGAYIGIAAASLVASWVPTQEETWRLVFLGCSAFGVVVFILRRYLIETPPFLAYQQKHLAPISLKQVVQTYWAPILQILMICGSAGGTYHFYLVFQGTYLFKILGLVPQGNGTPYSFWLTTVYVLTLPFAGWAADSWGLARMGKIAGCLTLCLATIHTAMIAKGIVSFPLMVLITMGIVFFLAPAFIFFTQHLDVSARFRCQSLGHAFGSMLFSGTTPVVSLFLWQSTERPCAPYLYFLFLVAMGVMAFIWGDRERPVT